MPGQREERPRVRRDMNLTVVAVVLILSGTAVVLAYLANLYQLASQGLDVRDLMPRVRLGPEQWGWLAMVVGGIGGGGFLVKRSNRTEALVGRRVPEQVREALEVQREAIVDELGSLFARALLEHRERVAAEQPEADVDAEDMIERMAALLEAQRPAPSGQQALTTGEWDALVHGH